MDKEKVNWWWFFLIEGTIVIALFLINKYVPVLDTIIFRQYFIEGLNPVLPLISYFFLLSFICAAFKINNLLLKKGSAGLTIYLMLGLITIILLLPIHILVPFKSAAIYPRRYIEVSSNTKMNGAFYLIWIYLLAAVFLFFYITNFPKKIIKT